MLKYKVIVEGPFAHNTVVIWDESSLEGFLLDPGSPTPEVEFWVSEKEIQLKAIILTHAHLDHIGALKHYKDHFDIPFYIHDDEKVVMKYAEKSCRMYGLPVFETPHEEEALLFKDGDILKLGESQLRVIETPGHTPGGVCFYGEGLIFVGDTLFAGSIGRTDLPGGSFETLQKSLRKLIDLPDYVCVISGHGPDTTLGREKKSNPYLLEL